MNVISLDLSLTGTGICDASGVSTVKPGTKLKDEARLDFIWREISNYIPESANPIVAIEGLAFGTHTGKAMERAGLQHIVRLELWRRSIPYVLIPPTSVKKYAVGKGNAQKDEVMISAVKLLPDIGITNNNESDAAILYAMTKDHYGEPIVTVPAANRTALDKIVWP